MAGIQIGIQSERFLQYRISGVHQAGEIFGPQGFLVKRLRDLVEPVDRHIEPPLFHIQKADITGRKYVQGNVRCFLADPPQYPWHQAGLSIITGHDPEHALAVQGRERCLLLHGLLNIRQDTPHQRLQFPRALRGRHALAGSHQQRIAEQVP